MEKGLRKFNFHLEKPRDLKKYFYRSYNINLNEVICPKKEYTYLNGVQEFLDKYEGLVPFFLLAFLFIFSLFGKHFYLPAGLRQHMKDLFPLPSDVDTEGRTETLSVFAFILLPFLF